MVAGIVINRVNKQLNKEFDYLIPNELLSIIKVGFRVKVRFGNTIITGFVTSIKDKSEFVGKLSPIIDIVDSYPVINQELVNIASYIKERYFTYYALALDMMIPQALKLKYERIAIALDEEKNNFKDLTKNKIIKLKALDDASLKIIYDGVKDNIYKLDVEIKKNRNEKTEKLLSYNPLFNDRLTYKEQELLAYLDEIGEVLEEDFLTNSGYSKTMVNKLIKINAINVKEREILDLNYNNQCIDKKVTLNQYQENVINSIDLSNYNTYLLHGITGSGKTEVYLNLIEKVIENGKHALMLVPEISLTPQITSILLSRFKSNIAIIHSRLSIKDKYVAWRKIYNNEIKIVVGARSAIFSPIINLGIIIIDEEHEQSYIQDNNPKYNAKEIAILRAKNHNCPLILGSATPDVKDYYYAVNGEYKLLTLPVRANNKELPSEVVVDMREELKSGNKSCYSEKLKQSIIENYKNHHQTMLFLNRRGFSSFVMCRDCGHTINCPHCDVTLTYHSRTNTLVCHHCSYQIPNIYKCPNCNSDRIKFVGVGTEKLEEEARKIVPEARILRMDYDTTKSKDAYNVMYNSIKNNEVDIIIGTQMITKGLDFENVTLVGVVNADIALKYPEYDAYMHAFNLIEQVSGRAGRKNLAGKVYIQTYNPDNYVIMCAKNHNYDEFFKYEIKRRNLTKMPPFSEYIKIMVSSKDANIAYKEASTIRNYLLKDKKSIVLGPSKDYIFKIRDEFRYNIEVHILSDIMMSYIDYIYPLYQDSKEVNISITRM